MTHANIAHIVIMYLLDATHVFRTHLLVCLRLDLTTNRSAGAICLLFPAQINTLDSGEIDYDHLTARLEANKDRPAILNVNIGTTVKGAVDDLDRVLSILESTGVCACRVQGCTRVQRGTGWG